MLVRDKLGNTATESVDQSRSKCDGLLGQALLRVTLNIHE